MTFARERSRGYVDNDRQLVLALVKDVEIVGEAATQVSQQFFFCQVEAAEMLNPVVVR